jgi:hypothetical protein
MSKPLKQIRSERERAQPSKIDQARPKSMTTEQLGEALHQSLQQMTPEEKAEVRKQIDQRNRCRRSNGTLRAWFSTAADAVAFAENPANTAYHGDVAVECRRRGCGGWHLSQPHWPDAQAAANARVH